MIGRNEVLYDIHSGLIAAALFLLMVGAMLVSNAVGRRRHREETDETRSQTTAVQGSLLGLLALLLGFTFSLALGRHDARSQAVVAEANAIGTAALRSEFLPDGARAAAEAGFLRYTALRIEAGNVTADDAAARAALVAAVAAVFDELWEGATLWVRDGGGPAAVSYAASLNDMIDALSERDAAIDRHVPEVVLLLMFLTFVLSGVSLGYGAGTNRSLPRPPVYMMLFLITLLVFMIIDLDRPRRGLIAVDQTPMTELAEALGGA